jgi:DNA polymerase bacteriophage-type
LNLLFDRVCFVDFESYYDTDYSLSNKKLTMTQYIRGVLFKPLMVGVQLSSWREARVMTPDEFMQFATTLDWRRTAFCAHHCQFDGFILTHHYQVYPSFWIDTMSMSRLVFGVDVKHSLDALSHRLGRTGKKDEGKALHDLKGVRDLTPEQYNDLSAYAKVDVEELVFAYEKLRPAITDDEMRVMDTTIAMYTEPCLMLDDTVVLEVQRQELERKAALLASTDIARDVLGSNKKFAAFLESRDVEVPMKISPRTGEPTYAFAKNDLDFQELLDHPDPIVATAVEARLGTKGSLVETRSARMLTFAGQPMPIYLAYWAARTGRWGGGDRSNWQNLPRGGLGADLRRGICALPGFVLIPSDAAQIEARLLAWRAGQYDILNIFAANGDVYAHNATAIYGFEVDKDGFPLERFVGKVFTLGAGFGAGGKKMNHMLRSGQMGPKVDVALDNTIEYLRNWRFQNARIVSHWEHLNNIARTAFLNKCVVEDGVIVFEGRGDDGYIHLPNETYIRYRNVRWNAEEREMTYASRNGITKLYGGILAENTIQALARCVFAYHINQITAACPDIRIACLVHDDVVSAAPESVAAERAATINRIMSTPPPWAAGLPLNAETKIGKHYGKAK